MSNVRIELICGGCNAHRCVYYNKMVGSKGGPKKSGIEELHRWLEGGYMCGSNVPGEKFYFHKKLFFGEYIESQYYNYLGCKKANNSGKGRILSTGNICAICYSFQDFLSDV